jgi:large subunit ribosomal protein L1
MIRTTISLPNWSGKTPKICVFSDGSVSVDELKKAWAEVVWDEELIIGIEKGNISPDFDICVSSPSMMRHLWKIARVLWPKGLMPNPKTWTVWEDLLSIVKEIAAWKFEFKTDKQGNIHSFFGKLSFGKEKLIQNLEHFLSTVNEVKPSWSKWRYIDSIFVCNAMWPSIKLDLNKWDK